jgi:hypothetical protein
VMIVQFSLFLSLPMLDAHISITKLLTYSSILNKVSDHGLNDISRSHTTIPP